MTRRRRKPSPKDVAALKLPYELYVAVNGGVETCGVCGATGKTRRLHRDHDHVTGEPRGLLCYRCNLPLRAYVTRDWLVAALHYLDKAAVDGPSIRTAYERGDLVLEPID